MKQQVVDRGKNVLMRNEIEALSDYLLKWGFECEGVWYFRNTWINRDLFRSFQEHGLVERVGTSADLKERGISLPDKKGYTGNLGNLIIYCVSHERLGTEISMRK